ncbi:MAG TPA: lipopolysaccharide kinase InaA family protein, partial [Myxococcota bacterium]|nr:lipopolysaccharide kinase InaA family protein [Myxococcota bacterium]
MSGLLTSHLQPEAPDFLDLPWHLPLSLWEGACDRLERLPRGESRHPVVFVAYERGIYALKEMGPGQAEHEYLLLRSMAERALPVVQPIGHLSVDSGEPRTVLITRFLEHSIPYHSLFLQSSLSRYRDHLLDALASLLVQLHLSHVFWGDCSLFNTLFVRDAGALQAYLVDAETSQVLPALGDGLRHHDLELMEENVTGGLLDLVALGALPPDFPALDLARDIRRRYDSL